MLTFLLSLAVIGVVNMVIGVCYHIRATLCVHARTGGWEVGDEVSELRC
jgi:hypothetical protein